MTNDDLARAKAGVQTAAGDLRALTAERNQAEGALAMTGGDPLREEFANAKMQLERTKKHQLDGEVEAESWSLLLDTLRDVENSEGTHLGKALAGPVSERFGALTRGRYGDISLGKDLDSPDLTVTGIGDAHDVIDRLSVGTKDQLATLLRLAIARAIESTIVLDDHLVHADQERMAWFTTTLEEFAADGQVVVITCRPDDYRGAGIRKVDMTKTIVRWKPEDTEELA